MTDSSPKVSILVISYNTREMTLECLRSVKAETTNHVPCTRKEHIQLRTADTPGMPAWLWMDKEILEWDIPQCQVQTHLPRYR